MGTKKKRSSYSNIRALDQPILDNARVSEGLLPRPRQDPHGRLEPRQRVMAEVLQLGARAAEVLQFRLQFLLLLRLEVDPVVRFL